MARPFDLKRQLRVHNKGLLRRLLAEHGQLLDFPWEGLLPKRIDQLFAAWERIDEKTRRTIQVVLQDVHQLADERGQLVLSKELASRFPEKLQVLPQIAGFADRALWVYLEAREAFDRAALLARAEALRGGQFANRWNSLPPRAIEVQQTTIAALEEAIRDFYWRNQLRGPLCRVHHYRCPDGMEFFFAYLPDWPDKRLVFDTQGNLTPREEVYTFSNVFIYEPQHGAVELVAKGGMRVHQALRKAFCRAVLGIKVEEEEPIRPAYRLDHLLDPHFSFTTEPQDCVAAACLRRVRLMSNEPKGNVEHVDLKFREATGHAEVIHKVERVLAALELDRSKVTVREVDIQLRFRSDGYRQGRTLLFRIRCPNTCDLKSKPDSVRQVAERCVRRWGIQL